MSFCDCHISNHRWLRELNFFLFERYIPKLKKLQIRIFKKALVWEKSGFFWFFLLLFFYVLPRSLASAFWKGQNKKIGFFSAQPFFWDHLQGKVTLNQVSRWSTTPSYGPWNIAYIFDWIQLWAFFIICSCAFF